MHAINPGLRFQGGTRPVATVITPAEIETARRRFKAAAAIYRFVLRCESYRATKPVEVARMLRGVTLAMVTDDLTATAMRLVELGESATEVAEVVEHGRAVA